MVNNHFRELWGGELQQPANAVLKNAWTAPGALNAATEIDVPPFSPPV